MLSLERKAKADYTYPDKKKTSVHENSFAKLMLFGISQSNGKKEVHEI